MRQGDGSDLLGAHDPRSESIGIIYVATNDDRESVLEAIFMQDKLGRKQVAIVLPENNRAFQRPIDFDGLKNVRRGLKTEIIFIAPGAPGPADFARQRRFLVYTSLESYATALRAEPTDDGNGKKGGLLPLPFGRKAKSVPLAEGPASKDDTDERRNPPPLLMPVPDAAPKMVPPPHAVSPTEDDDDETSWELPGAALPLAGLAGAGIAGASLINNDDVVMPLPPSPGNEGFSPNGKPASDDESVKRGGPPSTAEPGIIAFPPSSPRPKNTAKLPIAAAGAGAAGAGAAMAPTNAKKGNTGKFAAVAGGAAAMGAGAAMASGGRASATGGGQPPTTGNAGGPGGGGGGGGRPQRRVSRQLLAILLILLTLLLLAAIAFASPAGHQVIANIFPGSTQVTATVTIVPDSSPFSDNFVITAVTGKPDPSAQQVQARILSDTSSSGSASANATGSIPGANATGTLRFINISNSGIRISGGTLTGGDGVQVSYGSIVVPVGSIDVIGTAVNQGVRGNIGAFDISGSCCGSSNILVKNPFAFGGGRDPIINSIITQNDIAKANNTLIAQLKPSAQAALQQQVKANEQVVNGTLTCTPNTKANHTVGDQAKSVTVTGTVTCTEEVFDRQGAVTIATNALAKEALKNPGPSYGLVGNVVTNVTGATVIDAHHTVSLQVSAQGVWAYVFSAKLQQQFKDTIATKSESAALTYLKAVTGVKNVDIKLNTGNTMPDAAHITIVIQNPPGAIGTPTVTPVFTPTTLPNPTPTPGLGGS